MGHIINLSRRAKEHVFSTLLQLKLRLAVNLTSKELLLLRQ